MAQRKRTPWKATQQLHVGTRQSKKPKSVGGRFCSINSVGAPLVPREGCDWLVWIFCGLAEKWNRILRNKHELHLVPFICRVVWLGNLSAEAKWEGNWWLGHSRPFQFHQMSRQHTVLISGLIPHFLYILVTKEHKFYKFERHNFICCDL